MHQSEQKINEALNNTRIVVPITGTILKILARPGERIGDRSLLEMADLSQLDVVAEVSAACQNRPASVHSCCWVETELSRASQRN